MKLTKLIQEWVVEGFSKSDQLEESYFELNEIRIDPLNSYIYKDIQLPHFTKSFIFEDRCGNSIVACYIGSIGEFKTGYKIEGVDSLIFEPEKIENVGDIIKPCPDDKKIGTIYKILTEEIIPTYLLNKKPNKILFNPVSVSRKRLVSIINSKVVKQYPQLTLNGDYLIYI